MDSSSTQPHHKSQQKQQPQPQPQQQQMQLQQQQQPQHKQQLQSQHQHQQPQLQSHHQQQQLQSHHQQQQLQSQQHKQQQPNPMFPPLLLSPTSNDPIEHEQIIEQVISLENEFSETAGMLCSNASHQLGDINLGGEACLSSSNQFLSSSDDLFNLLIDFDREPSNMLGSTFSLGSGQNIEQDEKTRIESIRKQLLSCDVQSDTQQNTSTSISPIGPSSSPIVTSNQIVCQNQQQAPVLLQHPQMLGSGSMVHGNFSNVSFPVPSSSQNFISQQQPQPQPLLHHHQQQQTHHHQHHQSQPQQRQPVSRVWQQQNSYTPEHQATNIVTANSEPSPVVRKNPLLNAQLVNSRSPSVPNQNPVINVNNSIQPTLTASNYNYCQMSMQNPNNIFKTSTTFTGAANKPEIRRKTSHQPATTSLLKQLLSEEK